MYQTHILPNGLKIIHQHTTSKAAYCGIIIGVGSRDEIEGEEGIAHFIEHVIFKGTSKRRAYHILNCVEGVGGELNAYTTKEDTCIHAAFQPQYYSRVLSLFSDILFDSQFPEKELEKEKDVVIDEINSYKDSPSESIFDDFEELVYDGQPLGRNILGSEESVNKLTREDVLNFVHKHYIPSKMVISSVGDIEFSKLIKIIEKYFGHIHRDECEYQRQAPTDYQVRKQEIKKNTFQAHTIVGSTAYDQKSEDRVALSMLLELLGGGGMNSRLNMSLRERHALAYNIETNYTPYSDTGLFNIYLGCDHDDVEKSLKLIKKEIDLLCAKELTPNQLARLKRQIMGQITLSSENYESAMLANGKSYLVYGRIDTFEEVYNRIDRITAEQLLRIARDILNFDRQSILIYQ